MQTENRKAGVAGYTSIKQNRLKQKEGHFIMTEG